MTESTPFRWPIRVYYEDTDAGGVVYHANYLNYFERARTELLREIGVNQQALFADHTAFVVRHMDIDFHRGARLDDALEVVTTVSAMGRASMTFCQSLVNSDQKALCAATVKIACVDPTTMKPKSIPTQIKSEMMT
ncbi:tol-pal system-associated acyl-CoA thioesterase [Salinivibrio kushneri]|uniref:Tol-pal system-associated acyl-CoA thioesterase n=1 Tax=Salinivibrio kushneri TaxID=1908198 RepID=A0AA47LQL8_9GAMM|nr:tol-pal system-associated acyl-CoA thioesterase [Salinivibrio kushneri]WBA07904.1 tol-pal system-associated acyl-CoA thioesterase [Salinivibrio kushneri]